MPIEWRLQVGKEVDNNEQIKVVDMGKIRFHYAYEGAHIGSGWQVAARVIAQGWKKLCQLPLNEWGTV